MSNTSVPLFVPPDRPLDPVIVELLAALSRELARLACPFMLVGATARDILLVHVFGMHVARATMDVDIAVEMDDWSRFAEVRNTLTNLELAVRPRRRCWPLPLVAAVVLR